VRSYELRDPQALDAPAYYRLRQVDTDQTVTYSAVASLSPGAREAAQVHVYPNPGAGTGLVRLALRGLAGEKLTVQVQDLLGRSVATQRLTPATYQADAPLALPSGIPAGVYVVSVTDGHRHWTVRWTLAP
jgi:hypothetical protein